MSDLNRREIARRKISAFYREYFPERLDQIEQLLDKYVWEEDKVVLTFQKKYPKWDWSIIPPPDAPSTRKVYHQSPISHRFSPTGSARDHNLNITLTLQTQPGAQGTQSNSPQRVFPPPSQHDLRSAPHQPASQIQLSPGNTQHNLLYPRSSSHQPDLFVSAPDNSNSRAYDALTQPSSRHLRSETVDHTSAAAPPYAGDTFFPLHASNRENSRLHATQSHGTIHQPISSATAGNHVVEYDAGHIVSRGEIENAFAALESKLTEVQRQDAAVLEAKLDQLLQQMQARLGYGQDHVTRSELQQQLNEVMGRIDALTSSGLPLTTPFAPDDRAIEELSIKVRMLESQLTNTRQSLAPASSTPLHDASRDGANTPTQAWQNTRSTAFNPGASAKPYQHQSQNPQQVHDFVDLLKQENSKKNAEIDVLAHNTQNLQNQLSEQQDRYLRDVTDMQRKLSALEGQQSAVHDTKELAQRLHAAVSQAAVSQKESERLLQNMHSKQNNSIPSALPSNVHGVHIQPPSHPASSHVHPSYPAMSAGPASRGYDELSGNELKHLQEEIDELRRRDDLSRKLIHEKQMLLDTMFALSHQQAGSPPRGMLPMAGGSPGMRGTGGGAAV
ncbi:hypothetical protein DIPPA_18376 [Diplonema papillatum]|nr:hypothetical protein DIPPA_18376 [Diplonema papillatum]